MSNETDATTIAGAAWVTLKPLEMPQALHFHTGKTHVVIAADGTVTYGEGYDPDEAAKCFWEAIGRHKPGAELVREIERLHEMMLDVALTTDDVNVRGKLFDEIKYSKSVLGIQ